MQFSTKDRDNDGKKEANCAEENTGGWWYKRCHYANLNGQYHSNGHYKDSRARGSFPGIDWAPPGDGWKNHGYSLMFTEMKIKPK